MLIAGIGIVLFFLACAGSVLAIGLRAWSPVVAVGPTLARARPRRVYPAGIKPAPETWPQMHSRAVLALLAAGMTRQQATAVLRQRPKRARRRVLGTARQA